MNMEGNCLSTVCKENCSACKLCADVCPVDAISVIVDIKRSQAYIDQEKCIKCNLCHTLCPQTNLLQLTSPIEWYQGWARNDKIRKMGSSGGVATEISRAFIEYGGVVCTCHFQNGTFGFDFFESFEELKNASGSKYIKSDPTGIYKQLDKKLSEGKKVLMIGLPCQIAAARNYVQKNKLEGFYSVDLICHGTPSPEVLKLFLRENGIDLIGINRIQFRDKIKFGLKCNCRDVVEGYTDEYTCAFLDALIYTENCYHCRYARLERVADITLGDSWGSELSEEEKKGISLILCQSEKGKELLTIASIDLKSVDLKKAIAANCQLQSPAVLSKEREKFLSMICKGNKFSTALLRVKPKRAVKNMVKKLIFSKH